MSEEYETGKASPEEMMTDEQRANQQEIRTGEEFELTQEIEASIFNKVQDINQDGVAFSAIAKFFSDPLNKYGEAASKKERHGFQIIKNILKEGLLGISNHHRHFGNETLRQWQWKRNARARRVEKSLIWFSITGRSLSDPSQYPVETGYMMDSGYGVAVAFDINKFKELPPGAISDWKKFSQIHQETTNENIRPELRTYSMSHGYLNTEHVQDFYGSGGKTDEKTDYTGFVTPFRVQPGLFSGLIIGAKVAPANQEEIIRSMIEIDQEKPNLLVPVYNSHGDLLWPRQMSNEEVKTFIAGRDKKEDGAVDSISEAPENAIKDE